MKFYSFIPGHPDPTIVWFKNSIGIDYKRRSNKYHSLIPSVLDVKRLTHLDNGLYSCMVKNDFGTVVRRTKLEVLGKDNSIFIVRK